MLYKLKDRQSVMYKGDDSNKVLEICDLYFWMEFKKPGWVQHSNYFLLLDSKIPSKGTVNILIDGEVQKMSVVDINQQCKIVKNND